jgi:succinyl-CoA synthetase beta subunit
MRACPEITEIDINPLAVLVAGQGVMALDALIVITGHDQNGLARANTP